MSIRTKDEIMASVKAKFGEDTSDEAIALIEDISDTLDATKDGTDWKLKYEELEKSSDAKLKELDNNWRTKYTSRFFDSECDEEDHHELEIQKNDELTKAESISINDLFTETK